MAGPDPLDALHLPAGPAEPRREFVRDLRRRIETGLGQPPREGEPIVMSELGYFTITVPDPDRARAFYGTLLGWAFASGSVEQSYQITNVSPSGGVWGGEEAEAAYGPGPRFNPLFSVDDIEDAVARVRQLGGEAEEPHDEPYGRISACRDDQGLRFDLLEPARSP
jgi:predicted enzyme related to lactoylglutathione lyase